MVRTEGAGFADVDADRTLCRLRYAAVLVGSCVMYEGVFELPTRLWDVDVGCGARWVAGSSPPWAIVLVLRLPTSALADDAGVLESFVV
jgi:hypothetical protein